MHRKSTIKTVGKAVFWLGIAYLAGRGCSDALEGQETYRVGDGLECLVESNELRTLREMGGEAYHGPWLYQC